MAIDITPEDRAQAFEVLQDYANDLFDAFEDGKITAAELREATTTLVAGAAALVIPDSVEGSVLPFLQSLLGTAWEKLDALFRNEARLTKRIAEAEAAGKTAKAARLREILDRVDG